MKILSNQHCFALYWHDLPVSLIEIGKQITITHPDVTHRILRVLRLAIGDVLQLFNERIVITVQLESVHGKNIVALIHDIQKPKALTPRITTWLPLLKSEHLYDAVSRVTALGINIIQLVITTKSRTTIGGDRIDKLQRIAIAAAEQSKQFNVPLIYEAQPLSSVLMQKNLPRTRIFFEPDGSSIRHILSTELVQDILICVGPEGDLTTQEKKQMQDAGFSFAKLTPTILKSDEAIALGVGIIRSWYNI